MKRLAISVGVLGLLFAGALIQPPAVQAIGCFNDDPCKAVDPSGVCCAQTNQCGFGDNPCGIDNCATRCAQDPAGCVFAGCCNSNSDCPNFFVCNLASRECINQECKSRGAGGAGSTDMGLSGTVSPTVATPGQTVTFQVRVQNNGPDSSPDISLALTPSGNLQIQSVTPSPSSPWTCTSNFETWTCTYSDPIFLQIAVGTAMEVTVVARPLSAGIATLTAMTGGGACDPDTTNNTMVLSVTAQNPTPVLTNLNPSQAQVGTPGLTLTINGSSLVNGGVVLWNNVPKVTTFVSATQVKAQLTPSDLATAGLANVTYRNPQPGGGTSNALPFTIVPLASITSFTASPTPIAKGQTSTLAWTTSNAASASLDQGIGSVPVNGSLPVTPSVTTVYTLTAANSLGTPTSKTATVTVQCNPVNCPSPMICLPDESCVLDNPVPTISGLNPPNVFMGSPSFTLTINGTNFLNNSIVKWNGADQNTLFVSGTLLQITVPASFIVNPGGAVITVFNSGPGGGTSNPVVFSIIYRVPTLTLLTPDRALAGSSAFSLQLDGTNFTSASLVWWSDQARPTQYVSPTRLTADIPASDLASAGKAAVTVTNPPSGNPLAGGGRSNALDFTIIGAPTATPQSVTTPVNTAKAIVLAGTDPNGLGLSFEMLSAPTHGTISGTVPNITYTPAANYTGPDSFTFRVNNGYTTSAPATVSITVTPPSNAPTVQDKTYSTPFRTAVATPLVGSDPSQLPLTFTVLTGPTRGTLSGTVPNLTYTPASDFSGNDTFTYKANNGFLDSNTGTILVQVGLPAQGPSAQNQTVSTPFRTAVTVALQGTDPSGLALTYVKLSDPTNGTLSVISGNQITYTPNSTFGGASDSFTFKVVNSVGQESAAATVTINVGLPAQGPTAQNQTVTTAFRTPITVTLQGIDPSGLALTYIKVTNPSNGAVSAITANQITYTPGNAFSGTDQFTFKVRNSVGQESAAATVTVNVGLPNQGPTANNQSVSTAFRTPATITLTATDPSGLPLTYQTVDSPVHGTLSAVNGNQIVYTPASNYSGSDSFTFKAQNSLGQVSNTATVSITVGLPTQLPTAANQSVSTNFRTPVTITLSGTEPNGLPMTYLKSSDPANGTVSAIAGNQITYTPGQNFSGADSFTFRVRNSLGQESNVATVSIQVGLPAQGPSASNQTVSTPFRTPVTISLVGTDPSGLPISYVKVTDPSQGTVSAISGNKVTYTPNTSFGGAADSFTFKVVNSLGQESSPATVTVNVGLPTQGPTANNQTLSTAFRTPITITLTGSDPSGLTLTYQKVSDPANGSVSAISGNQITFTPAANFSGTDSFTFRVQNTLGQTSSAATITIQVGLPSQGPSASNQTVSTPFRTPVTITLSGTDPSGLPITYLKVSDPTNGSVSAINGSQITYTPLANFAGADAFSFKVRNSLGQESNTAVVTVNVGLPSQGPTANNQSVTTAFRTPIVISLSGVEPSGLPLTYLKMSNTSNGTLSAISGNKVTYTPGSSFTGADSFTFKVENSLGQGSNVATVSITVTSPNAPRANDLQVTTPYRTAVSFQLTGSDPQNLPLTYTVLSQPARGTLSGTAPDLSFTPESEQTGVESFTFRVNNGFEDSNIATVTLTVGPIEIARIVVEPDGRTINAGEELQFKATAYDRSNREIPNVTYDWKTTANDGTGLSAGGLFRSIGGFRGARKYTVSASALNTSGSAQVTVVAPSLGADDICNVKAYPVPYKSSMGIGGITFTNVAPETEIIIFSADARKVRTLHSFNGENVVWDVRNEDGEKVASWVYYYTIRQQGPCKKKEGKLVVIQ